MSAKGTIDISFEGGLDLTSNTTQLWQTPGAATKLQNFESSIYGGYRRINGHTRFGGVSATNPDGSTDEILGVYSYADGLLACQGTGIYFSTDGITWLQVNKDISAGGDATALGSAAALPRTNQGRVQFTDYDGSEEYGIITFSDGSNKVGHFKITDTGGRKYYYKELDTTTAAPQAPQYSTIYKERLILSGDDTNPNVVYWSNRYTMDLFTGASAGEVDVGDRVTGVRSFRDNLYIFCRNSIHVLTNIDQAPQLNPVTRNIGCLCGFSIQEVAGDLVFLAPDGIRTLAGTTRIDDIELSTISKKITPRIQDIVSSIASDGCVASTVVRERNQYRLFYPKSSATAAQQKGIIGTLRLNGEGISWEWSETLGLEATAIASKVDSTSNENIYHGNFSGEIHIHDSGNNFDGANIDAQFTTPDIHYGNLALRKTLHSANLNIKAEGEVNLDVDIRYDFGSGEYHQPETYNLETVYSSAIIGTMVLGSFILGSVELPIKRLLVEGSGYSNSFKFFTNNTEAPYTVSSVNIEFINYNTLR